MINRVDIHNLLIAVIFTVLGITIPMLFHLLGLGSIFLPMYIPLAIGSYLMNRTNAAMTGFFTPLISAALTGMPPFYPPVAFIMMLQLTVFCLLISLLKGRFRNPLLAFAPAIIADRLILAGLNFLILPLFALKPMLLTGYDLLKGLPGIILMLILIPLIVPQCRKIATSMTLAPYEKTGE
jgi:hypothetical protein